MRGLRGGGCLGCEELLNFPARLRQRIVWADVILIVIGPDWFSVKDQYGRLRLENRFDYVRLEVELALFRNFHQGVPVVPVSVGGVSFSSVNLPVELENLLNLSGHEIRPSLWSRPLQCFSGCPLANKTRLQYLWLFSRSRQPGFW